MTTQPKTKIRPRLDYLDIAKALSILLVVLCGAAASGTQPTYRTVLLTFVMPLFFMVSGVVIRRHQSSGYGFAHWKDFFRKNVLALLVPYFIWGLIYCAFSYSNVINILFGSYQRLESASTLVSLWFLPCLFLARLMMELILMFSRVFRKVNRHLFAAIFAIPAFAVGFLLPTFPNGWFWSVNISFTALGFMLIGYAVKDLLTALKEKNRFLALIPLAVFAALLAVGILVQGDGIAAVRMEIAQYGNPALFLLNAFAGCGVILSLSVLLSGIGKKEEPGMVKKATLWIGRNTIGIYLLHVPLLQQVVMSTFHLFGLDEPALLLAVIGTALVLPTCCLIIRLIDRYIPQMFGKFPQRETLAVQESLEEAEAAEEV